MTEDIDALAERLARYNEAYRRGAPLVSDDEYDALVEALRQLAPDHPFLATVEPEAFEGKAEVRHPVPMLSTEKAYSQIQLARFVARVQKAAEAIGVSDVAFRVTPKLDGLAGRDDGRVFASRGNGDVGYEISSAFQKGVVPVGGRGRGIGEIVVRKSYFDAHLSELFVHPRNMVVGIVASDQLNDAARRALQDKAVHFVPYDTLKRWEGPAEELLEKRDTIIRGLTETIDYPVDGVVAEVADDGVKAHMGATSHHYRWQIALKTKGETAVTVVQSVSWQVGRTGNVTPVMEVLPVRLSGATIKRVTAHHAGMIRDKQIGPGARIEIIRSGEVIPKLERVIEAAQTVQVPTVCPSCETELEWHRDFLKCVNDACRAQVEQRISHWFRTLGSADWFGIKTIQRLVGAGFDSLEAIYAMTEADFLDLGFGPVQSKNLFEALQTSLTKPVEDWRFLAAFGIPDLGVGDSRKLLAHIPLDELAGVTSDRIAAIAGFGDITSRSITDGLHHIHPTLQHMLALGFRVEGTPLASTTSGLESPIAGMGVVFTGKMESGSREEMQTEARRLGARVQTAVSGKTDILVCGSDVGAKKIDKARGLNVRILSEEDYRRMLDAASDLP